MAVCSSYKHSSDIEHERLSYQAKFIYQHQNIIKGESETCPISEIAIIILSLEFIGSFEARYRVFFFFYYLVFPA